MIIYNNNYITLFLSLCLKYSIFIGLGSLIVFMLIRVLPGDIATIILGIQANEQTLANLKAELGLNQSFVNQYREWIYNLIHLELGHSRLHGTSVNTLISERLTVSLPLASLSFFMTAIIACIFTLSTTIYHNKKIHTAINIYHFIMIALPSFIIAFILIYGLALHFSLFPAGGYPDSHASIYEKITHLILPAITLSLTQAAIVARIWQSSLEKEMRSGYMLLARAKGLSIIQTMIRHALRSSLNPVLGILGLQMSFLFSGIIIIENIFALPGIGTLLTQSLYARDFIVLQNVIMFLILIVLVINLIIDIMSLVIDPRNQLSHHQKQRP